MKTNHQKIIKLLYDNEEKIDKIYTNPNSINILSVPSELIQKGIVLKLGNIVQLNPFYRQFVNTILLKADYTILFGNYSEHIKEIRQLKKRYVESNKHSLILRMQKLITDLYTSVVLQDTQIEALLYDMSNQISIELEQLIEEAEHILEKVQKFLASINSMIKSLDEDLASIHIEIEETINNVKQALEPNLENLQTHCNRFSELIRMSKEKKALNQKLFSLTATIVQKNDEVLIDYLIENQNNLIFTLKENIQVSPYKDIDLTKMINSLNKIMIIPKPKLKKKIKRKLKEPLSIYYINQKKILDDLEQKGCEDLYLFLIGHSELQQLKSVLQEEEAFKIFLLFSFNKEYPISISNEFNNMNIRRVSWN